MLHFAITLIGICLNVIFGCATTQPYAVGSIHEDVHIKPFQVSVVNAHMTIVFKDDNGNYLATVVNYIENADALKASSVVMSASFSYDLVDFEVLSAQGNEYIVNVRGVSRSQSTASKVYHYATDKLSSATDKLVSLVNSVKP